jgi:hypothetical protein
MLGFFLPQSVMPLTASQSLFRFVRTGFARSFADASRFIAASLGYVREGINSSAEILSEGKTIINCDISPWIVSDQISEADGCCANSVKETQSNQIVLTVALCTRKYQ